MHVVDAVESECRRSNTGGQDDEKVAWSGLGDRLGNRAILLMPWWWQLGAEVDGLPWRW